MSSQQMRVLAILLVIATLFVTFGGVGAVSAESKNTSGSISIEVERGQATFGDSSVTSAWVAEQFRTEADPTRLYLTDSPPASDIREIDVWLSNDSVDASNTDYTAEQIVEAGNSRSDYYFSTASGTVEGEFELLPPGRTESEYSGFVEWNSDLTFSSGSFLWGGEAAYIAPVLTISHGNKDTVTINEDFDSVQQVTLDSSATASFSLDGSYGTTANGDYIIPEEEYTVTDTGVELNLVKKGNTLVSEESAENADDTVRDDFNHSVSGNVDVSYNTTTDNENQTESGLTIVSVTKSPKNIEPRQGRFDIETIVSNSDGVNGTGVVDVSFNGVERSRTVIAGYIWEGEWYGQDESTNWEFNTPDTAGEYTVVVETSADRVAKTIEFRHKEYQIYDWHDLANVSNNMYADYVLMNDLDPSTDGYEEHVADPDGGWESLGSKHDFTSDGFLGDLDGQGHRISGLQSGDLRYVNATDSDIAGPDGKRYATGGGGLFEEVDDVGSIRNLGVVNVEIVGDAVGGIADNNNGEVTNSYTTGTIVSVAGYNPAVGGLVGALDGGSVQNSYSEVDVRHPPDPTRNYYDDWVHEDESIGGLVGDVHEGTIVNSYASGNVLTKKNMTNPTPVDGDNESRVEVGGLVGEATDSVITGSNASGNVRGDWKVGGVIGYRENGTVSNIDSTGSVFADYYGSGGLIGINIGDISGASRTISPEDHIDGGGLVGQHESGTITDSRVLVSGNVSYGFVREVEGGAAIRNSYVEGSTNGYGKYGFAGENGGLIVNSYSTLNIKTTDGGGAGFVGGNGGVSNGGVIRESYATGDVAGEAGFVGDNNGIISDSYSTGNVNVTDNEMGGGFVAENGGVIRNSHSSGDVTRRYHSFYQYIHDYKVGGFVGRNWAEGLISNSHSSGDVAASGRDYPSYAGGFVGENWGDVRNSSVNDVSVDGDDVVGGFVGRNGDRYDDDGIIANSHAEQVTVTGVNAVGGFVGANAQGNISYSHATGDYVTVDSDPRMSGYGTAGGFVGVMSDGDPYGQQNPKVNNSYSKFEVVTGGQYVGGFVGDMVDNGEINQTFATGDVIGGEYVGGFVGRIHDEQSRIKNSYTKDGIIQSESGNSGGFVGQIGFDINPSAITNVYSSRELPPPSGGFVSDIQSGVLNRSYWRNVSASKDGVGEPLEESIKPLNRPISVSSSEFVGAGSDQHLNKLDFNTTWQTVSDGTPTAATQDGPPILRQLDAEPQLTTYSMGIETGGRVEIASVTGSGNRDYVTANITVENTGNNTLNQTVGFQPTTDWSAFDTPYNTTRVDVAAGESTNVPLRLNHTEDGWRDLYRFRASLLSLPGSDSMAWVPGVGRAQGEGVVTINTAEANKSANETVANITVENTGNKTLIQALNLRANGWYDEDFAGKTATSVEIAENKSKNYTLTLNHTGRWDAGSPSDYSVLATLNPDGSTDRYDYAVNAGTISIDQINTTHPPEKSISQVDVDVQLNNTKSWDAYRQVNVSIPELGVSADRGEDIPGGYTYSKLFYLDINDSVMGNYTVVAKTKSDRLEKNITIIQPDNIDVAGIGVEAPDNAVAGEEINVTATVNNTSPIPLPSRQVVFDVPMSQVGTEYRSVTIPANSTETVSLNKTLTGEGQAEVTVGTDTKTANTTVSVVESQFDGTGELTIDNIDAKTPPETTEEVVATVELGNVNYSNDVDREVIASIPELGVSASQDVQITGIASGTTATFRLPVGDVTGDYTLQVETFYETVDKTITIKEAAGTGAVTINDVTINDGIEANTEINVTVENVGNGKLVDTLVIGESSQLGESKTVVNIPENGSQDFLIELDDPDDYQLLEIPVELVNSGVSKTAVVEYVGGELNINSIDTTAPPNTTTSEVQVQTVLEAPSFDTVYRQTNISIKELGVKDTQMVEAGGLTATTTITSTLDIADEVSGEYTVVVETNSDKKTKNITIGNPDSGSGTINISSVTTPTETNIGEPTTVQATLNNTYATQQSVGVEFVSNRSAGAFDSQTVEVSARAIKTIPTTAVPQTTGDTEYTARFTTRSGSASNVTSVVDAGGGVSVESISIPSTATVGQPMTVEATVNNTQSTSDTPTVEFTTDTPASVTDTTSGLIEPESTDTFSTTITPETVGEINVTAEHSGSSKTEAVSVVGEYGVGSVSIVDYEKHRQNVTATIEVANQNETSGLSRALELSYENSYNGNDKETYPVNLKPGEVGTYNLTLERSGSYRFNMEATTANSQDTQEVVFEQSDFTFESVDVVSKPPAGDLRLSATLSRPDWVNWDSGVNVRGEVNGVSDLGSVDIGAEAQTGTTDDPILLSGADLSPGTYNVTLTSLANNTEVTKQVTINERVGEAEVNITNTVAQVTPSQDDENDVYVDVNVTNVGDQPLNRPLSTRVTGTTINDARNVEIPVGMTETINMSFESSTQNGTYDVITAIGQDADQATIHFDGSPYGDAKNNVTILNTSTNASEGTFSADIKINNTDVDGIAVEPRYGFLGHPTEQSSHGFIESGESRVVSLTYDTGDINTIGADKLFRVNALNAEDTKLIQYPEGGEISIDSGLTVTQKPPATEYVEVEFDLFNNNTQQSDDDIITQLGGKQTNRYVQLDAGERKTIRTQVPAASLSAGEHVISVTNGNQTRTQTVNITTPSGESTIAIDSVSTNSTHTTANITVWSGNDTKLNQPLTVAVVGVDSQVGVVTVPKSGNKTVTRTLETASASPYRTYTLAASTPTDTAKTDVSYDSGDSDDMDHDISLDSITKNPSADTVSVDYTIDPDWDTPYDGPVEIGFVGVGNPSITEQRSVSGYTSFTATVPTDKIDTTDAEHTVFVRAATKADTQRIVYGSGSQGVVTISSTDIPEEVMAGDQISADATVANPTFTSQNANVSVTNVDTGSVVDSQQVSLSPSRDRQVSMQVPTSTQGTKTLRIEAGMDSVSETVTVTPRRVAFESFTTQSKVTEGDDIGGRATLKNGKVTNETVTVTFSDSDGQFDEKDVTIPAETIKTIPITRSTNSTGVITINSSFRDTTKTSTTNVVTATPDFSINALGYTINAADGTTKIPVEINNTGGRIYEELSAYSWELGTNRSSVGVPANTTQVHTVTIDSPSSAGVYSVDIRMGAESDQIDVVRSGGDFQLQSGQAEYDPITGKVQATGVVERLSPTTAVGELNATMDGKTVKEVFEIPTWETTRDVNLDIPINGVEPGSYSVSISSDDATVTDTVTIPDRSGEASVGINSVNYNEFNGITDVGVSVESVGSEPLTQPLTVEIGGTRYQSAEMVSLPEGGQTDMTVSVETERIDNGQYTAIASVPHDTDQQTFNIYSERDPWDEPFDVNIQNVTKNTDANTLTAEVSVYNPRYRSVRNPRLDVSLSGATKPDGKSVELTERSMESYSTIIETVTLDTSGVKKGGTNHTVVAVSEGGHDTEEIYYPITTAYTDPTITNITTPPATNQVEATVEVANVGPETASQTLSADVDGLDVSPQTRQVDIGAGGRESYNVSFPASLPDDKGPITITATTPNESATSTGYIGQGYNGGGNTNPVIIDTTTPPTTDTTVVVNMGIINPDYQSTGVDARAKVSIDGGPTKWVSYSMPKGQQYLPARDVNLSVTPAMEGQQTLSLSTAGGEDTTQIDIDIPESAISHFDIDELKTPPEVNVGEDVTVEAVINNTDTSSQSTRVKISNNKSATPMVNQSITVAGGDTQTVTATRPTTTNGSVEFTAEVGGKTTSSVVSVVEKTGTPVEPTLWTSGSEANMTAHVDVMNSSLNYSVTSLNVTDDLGVDRTPNVTLPTNYTTAERHYDINMTETDGHITEIDLKVTVQSRSGVKSSEDITIQQTAG